jgi:hypothetical protein
MMDDHHWQQPNPFWHAMHMADNAVAIGAASAAIANAQAQQAQIASANAMYSQAAQVRMSMSQALMVHLAAISPAVAMNPDATMHLTAAQSLAAQLAA